MIYITYEHNRFRFRVQILPRVPRRFRPYSLKSPFLVILSNFLTMDSLTQKSQKVKATRRNLSVIYTTWGPTLLGNFSVEIILHLKLQTH